MLIVFTKEIIFIISIHLYYITYYNNNTNIFVLLFGTEAKANITNRSWKKDNMMNRNAIPVRSGPFRAL